MISRRDFFRSAGVGALALSRQAQAQARPAVVNYPLEWSYASGKTYKDPFNEIELDVVFTGPDGMQQRVPAFWAGGNVWRVRHAASAPGKWSFRTISSDISNSDLHGRTGELEVAPYDGPNPLYRHGPIRVAADHRHLAHADGTPFFWLGDTNWMGLCKRLRWPDEFQALAEDRILKGFTVIQIVAGLYPDMPPFDPRGANEAGYPWDQDYARIHPAYFDMADLRIQYLADHGLAPCIVGCWGYFLPLMGNPKMKQHWRYLIARWSAYPVVWCAAGEGSMPYYLSKNRTEDAALQKRGWTQLARYIHNTDPYHRLVTIHPPSTAHDTVEDRSVLDFDMLQTGHGDRTSIPNTVERVTESVKLTPPMPVLVGEVTYEGIGEASRQEVQRFMFWCSLLSGTAGHTYGANGIWQLNRAEQPFGPSPHGQSWGDTPWDVAARLPGSKQVGLGKALLVRYPWWRLQPRPESVEPRWTKEDYIAPYAAAIPGELYIIFLPFSPGRRGDPLKLHLEPGLTYHAFFFDPTNGKQHEIGAVTAASGGEWLPPRVPIFQDWVLVVERKA
jgi:hypothetical protein